MAIERFYTRDITIVVPVAGEDRYGNTLALWDEADGAARYSEKGWLAQQTRSEDHDRRDAQVTRLMLLVPPSSSITEHTRVEIDDQVYEVDGVPNVAWTPRGPHHIEATLVAVAG